MDNVIPENLLNTLYYDSGAINRVKNAPIITRTKQEEFIYVLEQVTRSKFDHTQWGAWSAGLKEDGDQDDAGNVCICSQPIRDLHYIEWQKNKNIIFKVGCDCVNKVDPSGRLYNDLIALNKVKCSGCKVPLTDRRKKFQNKGFCSAICQTTHTQIPSLLMEIVTFKRKDISVFKRGDVHRERVKQKLPIASKDDIYVCYCGLACIERETRKDNDRGNAGRKYISCSKSRSSKSRCNYFEWCEPQKVVDTVVTPKCCVACNGTGRSYLAEGMWGPCCVCDLGDFSYNDTVVTPECCEECDGTGRSYMSEGLYGPCHGCYLGDFSYNDYVEEY